MILLKIIWFSLGFFYVVNVQAAELQALNNIEQAAYEYVLEQAQGQYDNPQVEVDALDSRLRLKKCHSKLEVFSKNSSINIGNQTIGVKCNSANKWTLYVPVKVKVFKAVIVAKRLLPAKHIITKNDLDTRRYDISSLRQGYVSDADFLTGQQVKFPVSAGSLIYTNNIRPQKIVRRGDLIQLVAAVGTMEVRMKGTALADAQLGQRVKVKNSSSKRVIEGVVKGPGIVKVAM